MKTEGILKKVKRDYSAIAAEFDKTRNRPWPEFEAIKRKISKLKRKKIKLLDAGCGNGRLAVYLKDKRIKYTGIDNNRKLLALAKKNCGQARFRSGDILKLPSPDNSFDIVCCIAVLHHIPAPKMQFRAILELKRVLAKQGILFLTVWNLQQKKYRKYLDIKTRNARIPWGKDKKIMRYYYFFAPLQLKKLLERAGFQKIRRLESKNNIFFTAQKIL